MRPIMKRSKKHVGEPEKKVGGLDDNAPSTLELSEGIKYFCAGIIISLDAKINKLNRGLATSLDAKINKLNEGLAKCSRNYNDMIIELKEIENGNRSPSN